MKPYLFSLIIYLAVFVAKGQSIRILDLPNSSNESKHTENVFYQGTSLSQNEPVKGLSVSPNPSTGIFNVDLDNQMVKLSVRDLLGNQLIKKEVNGKERITLDMSNMPKGVYFLEMTTPDTGLIKKIVLE